MYVVSGSVLKRTIDPLSGPLVPITKVVYYDTPYSVPSWGMKQILYDNVQRDNTFHDEEAVFTGRDGILSHSWGQHGHPIVGKPRFLAKWLGYFCAPATGTFTFYASADDGVKFYISSTGTPENLSTPNINSWTLKTTVQTSTYETYLTEGSWYPFRLEYLAGQSDPVDAYGDVSLQYTLPGETRRRTMSAGVANYPPEEETWTGPSDARFIMSGVYTHYFELPSVAEIDGDVALGSVGQYKIKLPLHQSEYKRVAGTKSHYKHVSSSVIIKPGRLIDIWAGYHTGCRRYSPGTCAIGQNYFPSGFLRDRLCFNNNAQCPYQESLPGNFVKRFRGRIVSIEAERDREDSYIELVCQDNAYYLQSAINENYPDFISYANFGYAGQDWSSSAPDGVDKPVAYDNFLLGEAVVDLCEKAGIDPIYLHSNSYLISGVNVYTEGPPKLAGFDVRLSKPHRYGNPLALAGESDVDDKYIWAQGFGEKLIDHVTSMAENYGYLFTVDPEGDVIFRPRGAPTIYPASGWGLPAGWHRIKNAKALTGSYLVQSGADKIHASITNIPGSRYDLYFALGPNRIPNDMWSILYNEGVQAQGYEHGVYPASDVLQVREMTGELIGLHYSYPEWVAYWLTYDTLWSIHSAQYRFPIPRTSYIFVNPLAWDLTINEIQFESPSSVKIDRSGNMAGIPSVNYYVTVKIGTYTMTGNDSTLNYADTVTLGSPTTIANEVSINNIFTNIPIQQTIRIPTSPFVLVSGTAYAVELQTVVRTADTNDLVDADWLIEKLSPTHPNYDPTYFNYFRWDSSIPWVSDCRIMGTEIAGSASPDPRHLSFMYIPHPDVYNHPTHGGDTYTWDPTYGTDLGSLALGQFTSPLYYANYGNRTTYPHMSFVSTDNLWTNSGSIGIRILDWYGSEVYHETYSLVFEPEANGKLRFSTEGIDRFLGRNPSIVSIRSEEFSDPITGLDVIHPSNLPHTIYISGMGANLEALLAYAEDTRSPRFKFTTTDHMFGLGVDNDTGDLRNDVIVVGNLKGPTADPDTGAIVNPNNPELDYVYSRALDIGSIQSLEAENSMGIKVPFVIFEPSISNQIHADWLAFAVLDRYRKINADVDWKSLSTPHISIDDPIIHDDIGGKILDSSTVSWVEGYSEKITPNDYEMTIRSIPLEPWPSYIPTPRIDVTDFADYNGVPNLIVDVRMMDELEACRNSDVGASVAYDPYEEEGGSLVNHPGEEIDLAVEFTLLVDAFVSIRVVSFTTEYGVGSTVKFIYGAQDSSGNTISSHLAAGTYIMTWDAEDALGNTHAVDDPDLNGIEPAGLYAANGKYYVVFEVESMYPEDHTVHGAARLYSTIDLPNLLNPEYANYGENVGADSHQQLWELEVGAVTQCLVQSSPGTVDTIDSPHTLWAVGGNSTDGAGPENVLTVFSTEDNSGQGIKIYLEPNPGGHTNRSVKYTVEVGIGSVFILPACEYVPDDYHPMVSGGYARAVSDTEHDTPGGGIIWYRPYPNPAVPGGNDVGWFGAGSVHTYGPWDGLTHDTVSVGTDYVNFTFRCTQDEVVTQKTVLMSNNGKDSKILGTVDYKDQWKKLNEVDTSFYFNPINSRWGPIYYDNFPSDYWNYIRDYWDTISVFARTEPNHSIAVRHFGLKGFNTLYAAKWFTFWIKAWDKSGRAPTTGQTWTHQVGVGQITDAQWAAFPPWQQPDPERINLLTVRAHWIPSQASDVTGRYYGGPVSGWLTTGQGNHHARRVMDFYPYDGTAYDVGWTTTVNGSVIQKRTIPCMHTIHPLSNWYDIRYSALDLDQYQDTVCKYTFFAWPIHDFWTWGNWDNRTETPWLDSPQPAEYKGPPPLTGFE